MILILIAWLLIVLAAFGWFFFLIARSDLKTEKTICNLWRDRAYEVTEQRDALEVRIANIRAACAPPAPLSLSPDDESA